MQGFRSREYGGQSMHIFFHFGYPKATIRSLKCSSSRWNTSLVRWSGAPSCMNHILSKSRSLWITIMNWFLNIFAYRAELIVDTLGPVVLSLNSIANFLWITIRLLLFKKYIRRTNMHSENLYLDIFAEKQTTKDNSMSLRKKIR